MTSITLNQNKTDFKAWLRSQPENAVAIAVDPCECWIAKWVKSQGLNAWVYPERSNEHYEEILLKSPDADPYAEADRVDMEEWAVDFAMWLDLQYGEFNKITHVTRDQAIEAVEAIAS